MGTTHSKIDTTTTSSNGEQPTLATNGRSRPGATEQVEALNELLASYAVHYQKLRNFHWNVVGTDFFDVHEKLEEQYRQAGEAVDAIAERIRVFGATPLSSMQAFLATTHIAECAPTGDAGRIVSEVVQDQEMLLHQLGKVLERAVAYHDHGTEDLMKGQIRYIEKRQWMWRAFQQRA